jgi:hypothetical protein
MTNERRARIQARLQEMTCSRASPPLDAFFLGWGPNEDGTKTFWCVGPGLVLVEGTTVRADTDVADFEQLQALLTA